jgi:hypothetical protein
MSMNAKQRKTALKKRRKYSKFREQRRAAAQAAGFGDDDIWVMRVGETRPIRP